MAMKVMLWQWLIMTIILESGSTALKKIGNTEDKAFIPDLKRVIDTDRAYGVIGTALAALSKIDAKEAMVYASKLEGEKNSTILSAVGDIYANSGNAKHLPFFEKAIPEMSGFGIFSFFDKYAALLKTADSGTMDKSLAMMKGMAMNLDVWQWKRFCAAKTINEVRADMTAKMDASTDDAERTNLQNKITELGGMLAEIQKNETSERLINMYSNFQ